jgi:hypothetical protein
VAAGGEGRARQRLARRGVAVAVLLAVLVLVACGYAWRGEIWRTTLDPKQPFPTYRPPPAPDYARADAWALRPADPLHPAPSDPPADVLFVHPTLYPGGKDWNGPIHDPGSQAFLERVVLPNYAGPFQRVGRVWAPRYRAASLFAYMTLRDDARDARRFAYGDVRAAFDAMLKQDAPDRPLVLAGAGQGGQLVLRLLQERLDRDAALRRRIAAVYLIDTLAPLDGLPRSGPLSLCRNRQTAGCTVVWASAPADDAGRAERRLERALTWTPDGRLVNLKGRPIACVNPLTGGTDQPSASARDSRGAANATGLEWGARPAFLAHEVSAACQGGLLRVSAALAPSLQRSGGWLSRRRIAPFNLFYADLEADAQARVQALAGHVLFGPAAPPITTTQAVGRSPVHRID